MSICVGGNLNWFGINFKFIYFEGDWIVMEKKEFYVIVDIGIYVCFVILLV